ncbi:MAG: hypothetical protein F4228_00355 [Acidobacteria bacterium]|nr:hypothetical protein [Acidobacteriota bacterium]MYF13139.1 hypothetical protein [Acidobacteriota bacterium]MYI95606.1 hypothetical protein [Acidobacteriota bacterium]
MTPTRHILMTLLATVCFAAATAAESGQPPRRGPYPDASQRSVRDTRFAFSTYGGFRVLNVTSDLFAANEFDFGITDDDFRTGSFGFEFDFAVLPRVDVSIGIDNGNAETYGSYLDLVYEDGGEIEHSARLALTDLSLGVRLRLLGGAARVRPYLVGGFTGVYYRYTEIGDFVDFETADIYYDVFEETSFLPGFFAGAGADVAVVRFRDSGSLDLFGEFRYVRSEGEHTEGFDGFGALQLNRSGGLFGLRIRW